MQLEQYTRDGKYTFLHFDTPEECEYHIMHNQPLTIEYKCCSGTGYAVIRKNKNMINASPHRNEIFISNEGTCDICFEEGISLFNTCTTCRQPFCRPCLQKITDKVCPYCRGKLRNDFE